MDSRILIRCGLVWFVLLLFALDGSTLIRADIQQLPAEKPEVESASVDLKESSSGETKDDELNPCRFPINDRSPTWFIVDQAFSDETGLLDVKTERSCLTLDQAEDELWRTCVKEINPILDRWYGAGASDQIDLSPEFVRDELIHDNLVELQKVALEQPVDGVSDFYMAYGRFELDQNFREFAKSKLQDSRTRRRLLGTGLFGGTVLSLLVVALGYMKLETATRGFYSRRLQTLALVLAVGVVVGAVAIAQSMFA